jgi:hypothetical protein
MLISDRPVLLLLRLGIAFPVTRSSTYLARKTCLPRTKILQFLPAVLLAVTGLGVAGLGSSYRVGSLTAMGPGFMPVALGVCLVLLALALFASARGIAAEPEPGFPLRPVLWVGGGILAWAMLIDGLGFVPASIVQLLFSSFALPQEGWRSVLILVLGMTLASYILFVTLLGVPVPAFGS